MNASETFDAEPSVEKYQKENFAPDDFARKTESMTAILKLYELRREEKMRAARAWYFSEFAPQNVMDIIKLYRDGERASAHYRTVTSYWDMACSLVLNGALDEKMFADAGTEHIFVYAKIQPFLAEIRQLFGEPDYLVHLETLALRTPDIEAKIEARKRLFKLWTIMPEDKIAATAE